MQINCEKFKLSKYKFQKINILKSNFNFIDLNTK